MARQLEAQKQLFRFQNVQLFKTKSLGIGSYGSVCKAMCDELPCAAKVLHPTIVDPHDPGAQRIVQRFKEECDFLSSIRHPHIVQCLGVTRDPESGLQVLLMELMDESLTKFLENAQEPTPYHIQVNLCHDIALALAFLHSVQIIHRDLSSNNVLLIGGVRAKVTDFGMSRLGNISPHKGKLTECPGTSAYMPPEAFGSQLKYTQKLDCFSFGVLGVQIMTGIFPCPSDSERIVSDPKYHTGTLKVVVPEIERRKDHIELIDPNHPLLAVALSCLKDKEKERPTSQELCHHLSSLKEASQYNESERESKYITKSSMARRERQIKEQHQQIQELQLQLTAQQSAQAKILRGMQQEKKQLQSKLEEQQQQVSYQKYRIQQLKQEKEQLQSELQQQQTSYQKYQMQQSQREKKQQITSTSSRRVTRDVIVNAIRGVKIGPGQQLRQVEVSPDVYQKAKEFAMWAPNFGAENQPYRFKMEFLYQLLQTNITSRTLQEALGEVEGWQSACKALLRYALNLLLAPKRPEFQQIKLSSSFYVYQVLRKLPKGAEKILNFMGYKATSPEMQELKYNGGVNSEQVLETAADLVILHSELDLIKELVGKAIHTSHPDRVANFITLWNILDVRGRTDERYDDTWQRLIKEAYQSQRQANLQLYPPHGPSSGPSSDITCGGRANPPVTDARRGSAPLLDQASVVHGGIVPVRSSQSHLELPTPAVQWPRSTSGPPPPSTNWGQIHPQPVPHQHYASSGSPAQPFLQSHDPPTTVCEHSHHHDPAATHQVDWMYHQVLHHQYAQQAGLAGCQVQHNSPPLSSGQPHHYHNMDHNMRITTSRSGSEHVATGRHGSEQATTGRRGSEHVATGRRGSEHVATGRRGSEHVATGRRGSEHVATGRRGSEHVATGRRGSEHVATGRRGSRQTTIVGHGTELTQNIGRKSDGVYANISETILESDRGVSANQSSAAKHEHKQSQPAEPVWIPDKTPPLHPSEKSYSFQEKVQHLFQQFPSLVEDQETATDPVVHGLWFCSYCTNLVSNSVTVCDVCGADQEAGNTEEAV